VLARLVEAELAVGEFDAAAGHAGLLIRVEPWQDLSHQLMIRARRANGDEVGALKHFEVFDAQHRTEFGTPASTATRDLVTDLLHHDEALPAPARTQVRTRRAERRPRLPWSRFAGRRPELGTIISRYAEAAAGRGNVVVVRGSSGSGKSALVRRAVNILVERDPALVVLGGAGEDPAQAGSGDLLVARLLAQRNGDTSGGWLDGPMVGALAERVRALGDVHQVSRPQGSDLTLLVHSLRELAARRPVLLVIDDFQWTTPPARNLVAELVRGIHSTSLFLLLAAQPARGTPGDRGVGSPAWLLDRVGESVGLTAVDLDEVQGGAEARSFVEAIVNSEQHALPGHLLDELVRLGAGHPLTTVELLRDLVRRGQVAPDRTGRLRVVGKVSWPTLPDRLVRLLEGQVADLPEHLCELVDVAAAHGPSFHLSDIARADGRSLSAVARDLGRQLGPRGYSLVEPVEGDGRVTHRFRQPVLREHLLARMDPHERRVLEARVTEADGV
jgi:energy-coupling factor transporter ATP-binding protein EcfA2